MRGISRLHHYEPVEIDRTQLDVLILELGEQGAERVVARALEELALRLERIDQAYRNLDIRRAAKATTGLAAIACQIGMVSFARVARQALDAMTSGDSAAIGASLERLLRVGEASLMSIWGVQDATL